MKSILRIAKPSALCLLALVILPGVAYGQADIPLLTMEPQQDGTNSYSLSLQVLLLMTALTMLPAAMLAMTSFTRIVVVLAILRQALGTAQTPSNQIILGLALFLSFFIMGPVLEQAYETGLKPYMAEEIEFNEAMSNAQMPFREFMLDQTREADLIMFAELGGYDAFAADNEIPMKVLLPSFVTSELKTAFQIGFLIFIPFLVIDLVVASVLMSMGMMMLSPMLISLPFKLMLFVLIDGWSLIVGTLASSFLV
ncbi:MAG: flagellar type III secretion system pore protein FliP [Halioglobus sp.]